jgi:hypothetical protein
MIIYIHIIVKTILIFLADNICQLKEKCLNIDHHLEYLIPKITANTIMKETKTSIHLTAQGLLALSYALIRCLLPY